MRPIFSGAASVVALLAVAPGSARAGVVYPEGVIYTYSYTLDSSSAGYATTPSYKSDYGTITVTLDPNSSSLVVKEALTAGLYVHQSNAKEHQAFDFNLNIGSDGDSAAYIQDLLVSDSNPSLPTGAICTATSGTSCGDFSLLTSATNSGKKFAGGYSYAVYASGDHTPKLPSGIVYPGPLTYTLTFNKKLGDVFGSGISASFSPFSTVGGNYLGSDLSDSLNTGMAYSSMSVAGSLVGSCNGCSQTVVSEPDSGPLLLTSVLGLVGSAFGVSRIRRRARRGALAA